MILEWANCAKASNVYYIFVSIKLLLCVFLRIEVWEIDEFLFIQEQPNFPQHSWRITSNVNVLVLNVVANPIHRHPFTSHEWHLAMEE